MRRRKKKKRKKTKLREAPATVPPGSRSRQHQLPVISFDGGITGAAAVPGWRAIAASKGRSMRLYQCRNADAIITMPPAITATSRIAA
jgi:hypothetical protein